MTVSLSLTCRQGTGASRGLRSRGWGGPSRHESSKATTPWGPPPSPWWDLQRALGLTVLVLLPTIFIASLPAGDDDGIARQMNSMTWLLCGALLFAGAIILYSRFRIAGEHPIGWLTTAVTAVAVHTLPFALATAMGATGGWQSPSGDLADLTVILPTMLFLTLAQHGVATRSRLDPLGLGVAVGFGSGLLRLLLHEVTSLEGRLATLELPWGSVAPMPLLALAALLLGAAILARQPVPAWLRRRVLLIAGGLVIAYVTLTYRDDAPGSTELLSLSLNVGSTALLVVVCWHLLSQAAAADRRRIAGLQSRIRTAEAHLERDEEVHHELRATLAGISAASQLLLHRADRLPHQQRERLEQMLAAEISRLLDLLTTRPQSSPALVSVDEVLAPLVVSQQSLGSEVDWRPQGHRAWVHGSALAEATHVLLANSAMHAPGARIRVSSAEEDGVLAIRVQDDGPGIEPAVRASLFERGVRGPASAGQGLGLHAAHRLLLQEYGSLSLEESADGHGSHFVIRLPLADPDSSAGAVPVPRSDPMPRAET